MSVTFRFLTPEQQLNTAVQDAFSAEHTYFKAVLAAKAAPNDPDKAQAVQDLDAQVRVCQNAVDVIKQAKQDDPAQPIDPLTFPDAATAVSTPAQPDDPVA